jgi:hypothetical protein
MSAAVFLITDILFGAPWAALVTAIVAAGIVWFWYGLPFVRRD